MYTHMQEVLKIVQKTGCRDIIDIGSGQGHLARYLAYHCGLNVVTVDAVGCHLMAAAKFDSEVERDIGKRVEAEAATGSIVHIESLIQPDISLEELLCRLGVSDSPLSPSTTETGLTSFILVGLHTCGDLGPTLLRLFSQSQRLAGVLSVGCCYMKLSCCPGEPGVPPGDPSHGGRGKRGYPMSGWVADLPSSRLSYEALEVACHSIDSYRDKISDDSHHVKVHCHRAVVETVLRKYGLRRSQVKISRRISRLPFTEYATAVLEGLIIPLTELERDREELLAMAEEWREVAVFFMLRLSLAPCVESLVVCDRLLFLSEQGFDVQLKAVFEPTISPRNLLVLSLK
ncbi:Protein RRNAD1 [Geodia barretti]|uniref:Protein RRNAD1 n=1 Tax=Geodia barretti TaxID=519541 RepID=A0AA35XGH2_GEOBA|nr:Protein RRNAD1 [Geodia barretti]